MNQDIITHLFNLYELKGSNIKYGEKEVTQLEHALLCVNLIDFISK